MRFFALEHDKAPEDDIVLADDWKDDPAEPSGDGYLATRLGPDALQKKLLKIARDARTAVEEQGVSILSHIPQVNR